MRSLEERGQLELLVRAGAARLGLAPGALPRILGLERHLPPGEDPRLTAALMLYMGASFARDPREEAAVAEAAGVPREAFEAFLAAVLPRVDLRALF